MMTFKSSTFIAVSLCLGLGAAVGLHQGLNPKSPLDRPSAIEQTPSPQSSTAQNKNQGSIHAKPLQNSEAHESSSLQALDCGRACKEQIIKKLSAKTQNLTDEDIRLIVDNAKEFAALLIQNPTDLAALLNTLENEDNARTHPAAFAITDAMSQEDHIEVSTFLLRQPDTTARIVGLGLINNLEVQDETSISLFNNLISTEADAQVLVTAINTIIADPKNGDSFAPALDTILSRQESDFVWGTALLTKVQLSPTDTKSNVEQALANPSVKMRRYGMQALHLLKEHHVKTGGETSFTSDPIIKKHLFNIVNDPDMDSLTIETAFNLISADQGG